MSVSNKHLPAVSHDRYVSSVLDESLQSASNEPHLSTGNTDGVRDGYAAVPTTPRPDSRIDQQSSQHLELPSKRTVAWEKPPEYPGSCQPEPSSEMTGKSPKVHEMTCSPVWQCFERYTNSY